MNKEIFLTSLNKNKKINLKSLNKDKISLYVCGITPYDYPHIGHGRCYITYDILIRLCRSLKYNITYCRNITDIDDKLINKAISLYNDPLRFKEISEYFYKEFLNNLHSLNNIRPDYEPRVTDNISNIIEYIKGLIKKDFAYIINGDVYFSVEKFKNYGNISNRNLQDQILGKRIKINELKTNPLDFVLWKSSNTGPNWESSWGLGRPGWHIECSVMAKEAFGDTVDIHGGGLDLIFPHHENENCISESFHNKEFVKIWLHCAPINVNKKKMSKSLNNFITMQDLFKKYNPMVFRYYILNHHHKTPIEYNEKDIISFEKSYMNLVESFHNIEYNLLEKYEHKIIDQIYNSACNDLNIAESIGIIFKNKKEIEKNLNLKKECKKFLTNICGLTLNKIYLENYEKDKTKEIDEINFLLNERKIAREKKNFKYADEIREKLLKLNIKTNDEKIN